MFYLAQTHFFTFFCKTLNYKSCARSHLGKIPLPTAVFKVGFTSWSDFFEFIHSWWTWSWLSSLFLHKSSQPPFLAPFIFECLILLPFSRRRNFFLSVCTYQQSATCEKIRELQPQLWYQHSAFTHTHTHISIKYGFPPSFHSLWIPSPPFFLRFWCLFT